MATLKRIDIIHVGEKPPVAVDKKGVKPTHEDITFHIEATPPVKGEHMIKVECMSLVRSYSKDQALAIEVTTHYAVYHENDKLFSSPLTEEGINLISELFVVAVAHTRSYQTQIASKDIMHNIGYVKYMTIAEARLRVLGLYNAQFKN